MNQGNNRFTAIRAAFRLSRMGLHLLWGSVTVALFYPFISHPARLALKQRWSRQLLKILNIRLQLAGAAFEPGCMIVSNHVSWIDIYAINAVQPAAFVSKADVRNWPLIGWLAAKTDTIFLRRGSRGHAKIVNDEIGRLLKNGLHVAVFPEGTTTDGTHMLNFHAALLQAAVDTIRPVQPLALSYLDGKGQRSLSVAYIGQTTLWQSMLMIARQQQTTLKIHVEQPLPTKEIETGRRLDRRALAAAAHSRIATHIYESQELRKPG